jgi:hypothetical protein
LSGFCGLRVDQAGATWDDENGVEAPTGVGDGGDLPRRKFSEWQVTQRLGPPKACVRVLNGVGRAVMPSSWTQSAPRAGARVQRIVPESYLHVAAVSRRSHLTAPATALMAEARSYSRHPREDVFSAPVGVD